MASSAPTMSRSGAVTAIPTQPMRVVEPVAVAVDDRHAPFERGVYAPSRRAGPVAILASSGIMLAALAALATLGAVSKHEARTRLTVVTMKDLDVAPPPPPRQLEKPVKQPPQAFVPKRMIELPSPAPTHVALDTPPPVAPPVVTAAKVAVEAVAPSGPPAVSSAPIDGGDLSSEVLSAKPPIYPVESRRHREQGTVKLLVLVGPDGRVSDIEVAASSGSPRLDRAALSAVRRWRWSPMKRNGVSVAVQGYVPVSFALD